MILVFLVMYHEGLIFTSVQRSSIDDNWPVVVVVRVNHLKGAFRGQRSMESWLIEVPDFKSEVICDLKVIWRPSWH